MFRGNLKMAFGSLKSARWRSLLTMFGIIVGVVSVVTTVSLGEGIKHQLLGQIAHSGTDLITIRPGKIVSRDSSGVIQKVNLAYAYSFGGGSLSEGDISAVAQTNNVKQSSPVGLLAAGVKYGDQSYDDGVVLGTNEQIPGLLQQKVEFGSYFSNGESKRNVAVIGKRVAEQLFKENVPVGMTMSIRGQDFVVRGVFEEFGANPLGVNVDLNKAIFIPYSVSKDLNGGSVQVVQVLAKPSKPDKANDVVKALTKNLAAMHFGQEDVTILRSDENLSVTNSMLNLLTAFIAGIAGISLLVGGVGIMNIMLASVSERTHEIGIRKAIGATNKQIRSQFLTEAVILSLVGSILGVVLSLVANFGIRISTNLKPVITWPVMVLAAGVSIAVGVIFGITPAIKASRKDPIDSLRHE